MTLPEIGMLWVGPELSWLEQLCLTSFVEAGHTVNLFSYDKITGVPQGVAMLDAAEVMPADQIMRHAKTGSPAYHADIFRLKMMQLTDMVWADTDAYCVQPWDIDPTDPFYGWISDDVRQVNNGVLRLPKDSKTLTLMDAFASDPYPIPPWLSEKEQDRLRAAKQAGKGVHVTELPWGVLGPDLLTHMLTETGEIEHAQPSHVIYPIPFKETVMLFQRKRRAIAEDMIKPDTLSIHLWGRRFRNSAAKRGGSPDPESYVGQLCAKHGIDCERTRHLMVLKKPSDAKVATDSAPVSSADTTLPEDIDTSMFSEIDVANLILQRSEVVNSRAEVVAWENSDDGPLLALARNSRDAVLSGALERLRTRCDVFAPSLDARPPKRIADIGCGYAMASLVLYHRYHCDLVLIDIEEAPNRQFGFEETGAAYSDLSIARKFLEANGVPSDRITTVNPTKQPLEDAGTVDLALSMISCGFHYPAETYADFYRDQVSPDGQIILDIRKNSGGIPTMKAFGDLTILSKENKLSTILVQKKASTP